MLNRLDSRRAHDLGDLFDLLNERRKSNQSPVANGAGVGAPPHVASNGDK